MRFKKNLIEKCFFVMEKNDFEKIFWFILCCFFSSWKKSIKSKFSKSKFSIFWTFLRFFSTKNILEKNIFFWWKKSKKNSKYFFKIIFLHDEKIFFDEIFFKPHLFFNIFPTHPVSASESYNGTSCGGLSVRNPEICQWLCLIGNLPKLKLDGYVPAAPFWGSTNAVFRQTPNLPEVQTFFSETEITWNFF